MVTITQGTPSHHGFRMPAEFEPHRRCWMLWAERPDNWRNGGKPAQQVTVEVASAIARFEPVTVGVSARQFRNARAQLPDNVQVVELSQDDIWIRDTGPIFVVNDNGQVRMVDWGFNAWGGLHNGLYFPWDNDLQIPMKIAELTGTDRYKASMILEGGAIAVDGQGTLITTEECLLDEGRNPSMSRADIEQTLCDYLGITKVIWLGKGIDPHETNGHVDDIVAYVRPAEVLLHWTDDPHHPDYDACQDAFERLSQATDAHGRNFTIHKLPAPPAMHITAEESAGVDIVEGSAPRQAGDLLPASYINFYIANGGIIAPAFGQPTDAEALKVLQACFPEREVVAIQQAREILLGGGNIHCMTQQQPRG